MYTKDSRSLVPRSAVSTGALARAGGAAVFAADEFFGARIRNPHTRRAYGRAGARFLDSLSGGPAAKQQALSGCRQYFAGLVQRHAMILNPFRVGHRRPVSGDRGEDAGDHHLASAGAAGVVRYLGARGPARSGGVRGALLHRRAHRRDTGAAARGFSGRGAPVPGEGREAAHHPGPRGSPQLAPRLGRGRRGSPRPTRRCFKASRARAAPGVPLVGGSPRTRRGAN